MTDAHCHVSCGDEKVRELLIGRDFFGVHPWEAVEVKSKSEKVKGVDLALSSIRYHLSSNPNAGVGEIGLDRLKVREIPSLMRELFEAQLRLALDLRRPVVLHGAKCWGQVVATIRQLTANHPLPTALYPLPTTSFLFHGFSRSDGLIPDIVALGGFISVGPAVLNDHAVNYRELVKKIPLERLLVETDRTEENATTCPPVCDVLAKVAELRGMTSEDMEAITDKNVALFLGEKL